MSSQDTYAGKVVEFADENSWRKSMTTRFKPELHLAFVKPKDVYTMESIGLPDVGVSSIAVSEPFQLFSQEAIDIMRSEVLADDVEEKHLFSSDIATKQLRGYASNLAKFTYEAWTHPDVLAIISGIAGVDLVYNIDYEIGHINISVLGKKLDRKDLAENDKDAVVGWHRDSYPFVCILMLSDASEMVGGETALKTGTGEIKTVRGPQKGWGVVLQGRYIEHLAKAAFGGQERITMVTSFRPRSPFVRDDTRLNTVRPSSHLPTLYGQVVQYQLENTEARVRHVLKMVREDLRAGRVNVKAIKQFLSFETRQLAQLNNEIVEEHLVKKGHVTEAVEAERVAEKLAKEQSEGSVIV